MKEIVLSQKLRAVLVGCGGISRAWLHACKSIENLEIVGLVDIREDAAKKLAKQFGLENVLIGSNLKEALEKLEPDMVFDCTVPEAHCGVTLTALGKGCHVLGEKPLAPKLEDGKKMVAAAKKAGKLHAITQTYRYSKALRRTKAFLDTGIIGDLHTVNADFMMGMKFEGFRAKMRHVLLEDMAIHTFDAARLLTDAKAIKVIAQDWNPPGTWADHGVSAWAVFDMQRASDQATLKFNYRGLWSAWGLNTTWNSSWRFLGSQGTALWDGADRLTAEVLKDEANPGAGYKRVGVPNYKGDEKDGSHLGVIREFVECVREDRKPETSSDDNIHSLAMVLAAIQSAEQEASAKVFS